MPKRIQRKRTRGWKMPEGAVSVTRPGKWGNPFPVSRFGLELCLKLFKNTISGIWNPVLLKDYGIVQVRWAYDQHCKFRSRHNYHPLDDARTELRGKDLMCWCDLKIQCHADILLAAANPPATRKCGMCGYEFDHDLLGKYGCPNCHGEGLE